MRKRTITLVMIALAAGCALPPPRPPVEMQSRFVGTEHDQYREQGSSVITGQGFLRQKGGGVVTCAGSKVLMFPATPFFQEFVGYLRSGRRVAAMEKVEPSYKPILKEAQCDAQGNFTFRQVPAGTWFVLTEVKWTIANSQQGGALLRQLPVAEGQSQQVLLSDSDFVGR